MNFLNATPAPRTGGGATPGGTDAQHTLLAAPELTMYKEQPVGEISLEDLEKFALDRLRVLKAIEEAKLRSKPEEQIQKDVVQTLWPKHMRASSRQESARKDAVSHAILRLAYCRSAELRSWLLAHEAALFRYRFRELSSAEQVEFFASMELPYSAISEGEEQELADELAAVALASGDINSHNRIKQQAGKAGGASGGGAAAGRSDVRPQQDSFGGLKPSGRLLFYQVPFSAVPDLVGGRRVLLRGGWAYVSEAQVGSLVVGAFRAHLSAALAEAARAWGAFVASEADRVAPLVDSLPSRSVYASEGRPLPVGEISAAELPGLAAGRHLPLCMAVMYDRLGSEHHLKHWGLQQFSLFLKAIGLPLEQALLFFRNQFAPRTPGDKFTKEYAYNIRYNYGQEGKRQDWSEWSCVKIINQEVGGACAAPGECNGGCPYKTLEPQQLRAALARLNCNERVVADVLDKARGKHYQLACGLAYEGITGAPQESGINKPSEYFASSIELQKQRAAAAAPPGGEAVAGGAAAAGGPAAAAGGPPATPLAPAGGQAAAAVGGTPA